MQAMGINLTGTVVFHAMDGTRILWRGPGSGLYLLWPVMAPISEAQTVRIEHRTAGGTYDTLRDARRAADAFLAAGLD